MRRQGAAGSQSDFLLEAAAGRQHRRQAAVQSFELVEHLRGRRHGRRTVSATHSAANVGVRSGAALTSVHRMARPSDSKSVSCSTRTLRTPSRGLPSTPLVLLQKHPVTPVVKAGNIRPACV